MAIIIGITHKINPDLIVEVVYDPSHNIGGSFQDSIKCIGQWSVVLDRILRLDTITDPLDKIWEFYEFGNPSNDPELSINEDFQYIYPEDPPLNPELLIEFNDRGYNEMVIMYPYSLVVCMKDGKITSSGRMD